jgi:hypothetical protein
MNSVKSTSSTVPSPSRTNRIPSSIDDHLKELRRLQTIAKQTLDNDDFEGWIRALPSVMLAAEKLRKHLLKSPIVALRDSDLRQFLPKVEIGEFDDVKEVSSNFFAERFDPTDYFTRLLKVNTLVLPVEFPQMLSRFCEEARQCYSLGLDIAMLSLCRMVLEVAINDIAKRVGQLSANQSPGMRTRMRWIAGKAGHHKVYKHYESLCEIVHGRSLGGDRNALTFLTTTLGLVSWLYERNAGRISRGRVT